MSEKYADGWQSLNLSKISVSILEHIVQPILGEDTIDLLREPVEKKELYVKLFNALQTSEDQFKKIADTHIAGILLSIDLQASTEFQESLLAFYENPKDLLLERILIEEVLRKAEYLQKAHVHETVRAFLNVLNENFVSTTSSEFREKIIAFSLLEMRDTGGQSLQELQNINEKLRQLINLFKQEANKSSAGSTNKKKDRQVDPSDPKASAHNPSSKSKSKSPSFANQQNQVVRSHLKQLLESSFTNYSAELAGIEKAKFFVDREKELQVIQSRYNLIGAENCPQFFLVQGDFGVGKTAMIGKFVSQLRFTPGSMLAWTRCVEQEEFAGWAPVIQLYRILLKKTMQSQAFDENELADYLISRSPVWLKLAFPEISDKILPASGAKQDVVYAQFLNFLTKISEKFVLTLVIDDIQWSDISSLNLLSYLASEMKTIPLFFLIAFRTEGLISGLNPELLEKTCNDILLNPNTRHIELKQGIDIREYIQARYQKDFIPNTIIQKVTGFSDGHALFIEQLFDHWQDEGVIDKDIHGAWVFSPSVVRELEIPRKVEGVLDLRARKMKDEYREILKLASVEGEDFSVQILSRLAAIDEMDLIGKLHDISEHYRLIGEKGPESIHDFTFDFYRFLHRFFREHFYSKFDKSLRWRLHLRIGEYLESLQVEREILAGRLAYHFSKAGSQEKSVKYAHLAAQEAMRNYRMIEATEWCKVIANQLEGVLTGPQKPTSETIEKINTLGECFVLWTDAAEYTGAFDKLETSLDAVIKRVRPLGNQTLYAKLLVAFGKLAYIKNDKRGIEAIEQAIKIFQENADKHGEYRAKCVLADYLVDFCNRFEEGIALQEELVEFAKKHINTKEMIDSLSLLAWSLLYVGKYDQAVQTALQAYELVHNEPFQDPNSLALTLRMLGYSYYKQGDLRNARRIQYEAVQKYHMLGDFLSEHWTRLELGYTLQALGEIDKALAEYDTCYKYAEPIQAYQIQEWVSVTLAKMSISHGNIESAKKYLKASQDLLALYDYSLEDQITLCMTWADYYFASGDINQIPDLLKNIENLLTDYHAGPIEARLLSLHGRCAFATGDSEKACEYLLQSLEICKNLNACIPTAMACDLLRSVCHDSGWLDKEELYTRMAKDNLAAVNSPWLVDDLKKQMIEWIF